jgi:hypothetical protein
MWKKNLNVVLIFSIMFICCTYNKITWKTSLHDKSQFIYLCTKNSVSIWYDFFASFFLLIWGNYWESLLQIALRFDFSLMLKQFCGLFVYLIFFHKVLKKIKPMYNEIIKKELLLKLFSSFLGIANHFKSPLKFC